MKVFVSKGKSMPLHNSKLSGLYMQIVGGETCQKLNVAEFDFVWMSIKSILQGYEHTSCFMTDSSDDVHFWL